MPVIRRFASARKAIAARRFFSRSPRFEDRKSTRLNSSHEWISYAVFCLKKKKQNRLQQPGVGDHHARHLIAGDRARVDQIEQLSCPQHSPTPDELYQTVVAHELLRSVSD